MQFKIDGVELFTLNKAFHDNRGYFIEVFKESTWPNRPVQSNASYSKRNVVRGLHYQLGEHAQEKWVQVLSGRIIDVILDIREGSPTFGTVDQIELTPGSGIVKIHKNLAHGFWALEESVILYHCSSEYKPSHEGGINPLSPGLDLPWLQEQDLIVSEKDLKSQEWRDYEKNVLRNSAFTHLYDRGGQGL